MMQPLSKEEYRRKFRVLDQMLTAHSTLRDRYEWRSRSLTVLIMFLSVAATAVAFISGEKKVDLGIFSWQLQAVAGLLTVVIFLCALLDLVTDWKRHAWAHDDAARRLGDLKLRFRGATIQGDLVDAAGVDLAAEYERTMNAITAIPDRQFLALKAKHKRKIAISQMLDRDPGAPIALLRLRLLLRDTQSSPLGVVPELPETTEAADIETSTSTQDVGSGGKRP